MLFDAKSGQLLSELNRIAGHLVGVGMLENWGWYKIKTSHVVSERT